MKQFSTYNLIQVTAMNNYRIKHQRINLLLLLNPFVCYFRL